MFFFLVQTEQGDIFKITMEVDEDMVSAMLFFNVYRFYKRILATQIFFTFSRTGYWNPHEVFWHCSCCGSHVCPQDWLSFYCLRIWKSVCPFDQQINNYSVLSKLQPTTLYLDMHLLLFICYICTCFFFLKILRLLLISTLNWWLYLPDFTVVVGCNSQFSV